MNHYELFKKNLHYYFLDHKFLRIGSEWSYMFFMCTLSAFIYAVGFRSFIAVNANVPIAHLATGGMSGISQCIIIICELCGITANYNTLQAIFYVLLNIPLLVFSFFKVGIKFSIFTSLNVILCSLFINYLPYEFLDQIAQLIKDDYLARSVFAGICTGLSSAIAFKGNLSAGGVDIIAYYVALRRSETSGKYIVILNFFVISCFTLLTGIKLNVQDPANGGSNFALAIVTALFSITYLFMSSLVVDAINVRNKKVQLQIVTNNENIYKIIVSNLPHSCTIVKGVGGYTKQDKFIIYAVVSNSEVSGIVKKIRTIDPFSFIMAISLRQVYGRFFIKPIE